MQPTGPSDQSYRVLMEASPNLLMPLPAVAPGTRHVRPARAFWGAAGPGSEAHQNSSGIQPRSNYGPGSAGRGPAAYSRGRHCAHFSATLATFLGLPPGAGIVHISLACMGRTRRLRRLAALLAVQYGITTCFTQKNCSPPSPSTGACAVPAGPRGLPGAGIVHISAGSQTRMVLVFFSIFYSQLSFFVCLGRLFRREPPRCLCCPPPSQCKHTYRVSIRGSPNVQGSRLARQAWHEDDVRRRQSTQLRCSVRRP
jgi:hypothetical protein